jgi:hypothetical protein
VELTKQGVTSSKTFEGEYNAFWAKYFNITAQRFQEAESSAE